jgi:hypothetical protein
LLHTLVGRVGVGEQVHLLLLHHGHLSLHLSFLLHHFLLLFLLEGVLSLEGFDEVDSSLPA